MPRPLFYYPEESHVEKIYELTAEGDAQRKFLSLDKDGDRIITLGNNDAVLRQNYEDRKEDGFDLSRNIRRVAHIDLGTVSLLAYREFDPDAMAYLRDHDPKARDRMIERYPELFKACSGRT